MNSATIQAHIWKGYGKSGAILGSNYQFYRPSGSGYPGTETSLLPVSLNAEDMKYGKPKKYGKATWYALVDGTSLAVGDYFIGSQGTFFIAAMQPILPILVVECNRTISISRPAAQSGKGAQPYSGMTAANETAYATNVPCSILQGTKGEKNETALPGDTRSPWWTVLLPSSVGQIKYGDLIIDDLSQRYIVSSNEQTEYGWRLNCAMAEA